MEVRRPDLSRVDRNIVGYIEYLEAEIERLRRGLRQGARVSQVARPRPVARSSEPDEAEAELVGEIHEPAEPPTTVQIITATATGIAKRTPRHEYTRQRRGGMGVFDIETSKDEPPVALAVADEGQHLLLMTDQARAFRLSVSAISQTPVRGRGDSIVGKLNMLPDERLVALLPGQAQGYIAMVSQRGNVRMLRHHVFGEYMKPGMSLYDYKSFGPLVSACWTPGDGDLFIATRQGKAIRFSEKLVPPAGGPGIRLTDGDEAVAITAVYDDSGVFLLNADGKGTIRTIEGFNANKAPGAGGKIAMATDDLIAAITVNDDEDDLFIISKLSKIIRFRADQVPPKDGVVQGVYCMALRADEPVAVVASQRTISPL